MTTLEIVRLDSLSSPTGSISNGPGSNTVSPNKIMNNYNNSNRHSSNLRLTNQSPPVSTSTTNVNRQHSVGYSPLKNNNTNNKPSSLSSANDSSGEYLHEIPISIIKSPSFNNTSQFNQASSSSSAGASKSVITPVLLSIETLSPSKQHQLEQSLLQNTKHNSKSSSQLPQSPASAAVGGATTPLKQNTKLSSPSSASSVVIATESNTTSPSRNLNGKLSSSTNNNNNINNNSNTNNNNLSSTNSSSNQLNSSDDIDYVLNVNNSSNLSNLNSNEPNTNTLRFNKYGFIQKTTTTTTTTTTNNNNTNDENNKNESTNSLNPIDNNNKNTLNVKRISNKTNRSPSKKKNEDADVDGDEEDVSSNIEENASKSSISNINNNDDNRSSNNNNNNKLKVGSSSSLATSNRTSTGDNNTTTTNNINGGGVGGGGGVISGTTMSSNGQIVVTNLKDYLQNTDVEEFAEQLPVDVTRSRENKWLDMLNNFDEWMEKRFKKIKSRCRKGIPQSVRSRAWMHLTGAALFKKQKPTYYLDCLNNINKVDVNKYIEDIKKDLHRQFPSHEIFMKKEGRQMLFNVLKAYAVHNKEVGYCQAQGPIAALLLMHMPEEDSFWMLIQISDTYLKEYFKPGLEKVQIDGQALFNLFKKENQPAYKLMKNQGIDPILYMTEWFMCIFARTLPWCTVLRVWDMFFCEGVKVLYRVGIYLMRSAFSDKQKFQRCQQQGMYETLNLLKNLPIESLKEAVLVRDSSSIKISQEDLKKAFEKSAQEFLKQTKELNNNRKQPPAPSSYINQNKKK